MSQWAHCMMASDIRVGVIWGGSDMGVGASPVAVSTLYDGV